MSDLLQHIIVIAIVAGCVGYVARAFVGTFRSGRGGAGSCCAKGCGGATTAPGDSARGAASDPPAGPAPMAAAAPDSRGKTVVFIPSDSLRRRK